jgi:hypothetical protein
MESTWSPLKSMCNYRVHLESTWNLWGRVNYTTFVTTFIGFLWDIPQKLVSLPEIKHQKFHEQVRRFLASFGTQPCTMRDIEKIHGSFCHIAFMHLDGRSRLPSLSNFAASFHGDEFITRRPSRSMITNLSWWLEKLSQPHVVQSLHSYGPLQDLGIYVDTSTSWGIGIIIGDKWAAFRLSPSWKIPGRDICWLETVAIELLIYLLEAKAFRETHLLLHSDNQGTIGAFEKGCSGNIHINLAICHTHLVLMDLSIITQTTYVESHANLADPISHGEPGAAGKQLFPTFKLPDELHQERATLVWLSLDALAVLEDADISLRHPSMDQGARGQLKHPNTAKLRQNI